MIDEEYVCDQPFAYNETSQIMVSYDNEKSFKAKGALIEAEGLGGYAMWEVAGDKHNILVKSIREGGGY